MSDFGHTSYDICVWYTYQDLLSEDQSNFIGKPGIVHLIKEDLSCNIMFTNWTLDNKPCKRGRGGYCSRTRSKSPTLEPGGGFFVRPRSPLVSKLLTVL
jgi:hypothetical protein